MTRTWITEHGKDFAVPSIVTEKLLDDSWCNDACPKFIRKDDPVLVAGSVEDVPTLGLWVEHPKRVMRDGCWPFRYIVYRNHEHPDVPETLLETNNAKEAVKRMLEEKL